MVLFFNRSIFKHYFIERRYIFWVKWDFGALRGFLSAVKFVFFTIYKTFSKYYIYIYIFIWSKYYIYKILYFHIFQKGFVALNAILQASEYVTILPWLCITIYTPVNKFFNVLLVVDLLIKIFYNLAEEKLCIYLQIHNHQ